jgi:hypothetical protein
MRGTEEGTMNQSLERVIAIYFGLKVEVVVEMKMCSLIRFRRREFIVDTADLIFERELYWAA